MKKVWFTLFSIFVLAHSSFAYQSFANQFCKLSDMNSRLFGVEYQISQIKNKQQARSWKTRLWRNGNMLVREFPHRGIAEHWFKTSNNKVILTRYFDQFQYGIEYNAAELSDENTKWKQLISIINPEILDELKQETIIGCNQLTRYSGTINHAEILLTWNKHLAMPIELRVTHAGIETLWKLTNLHTSADKIEQKMFSRTDFQTTDYADVGDNENDPLLRKMINMGFVSHGYSGFYDSEGNSLDHHH